MSADVLIKNGMVMDGTGKPAVRADVIIEGDRIKDVGLFPDAKASKAIDATGLAVAPGFIDAHTHLDFFLPWLGERWPHERIRDVPSQPCGNFISDVQT